MLQSKCFYLFSYSCMAYTYIAVKNMIRERIKFHEDRDILNNDLHKINV